MTKKFWQSKTFWVNIFMALAIMVPSVGEFVKNYPETYTWIFVAVNFVLRMVTKDGIQITD